MSECSHLLLASKERVRNNRSMLQPVSRVVDLLDPALNRIGNMSVGRGAAARPRRRPGRACAAIDGSFALVAADGITVRLARSLDRPMRYFLAKRHEGPALFVADRIDTLHAALERRRPRRSVPSELHAHGAGPLRRRDRARRLSRSRSDLHALLHAAAQRAAGDARRDRPAVRRRAWRTRSRSGCGTSRRLVAAGADRRRVLRRHRQRRGLSRHLPHDDAGSACRRRGSRRSC